jgi:hypothetical protein
MAKKNIQCSLVGFMRTTTLWTQGWHRFDGIVGSGCRRLKEDDSTVDLGTVWAISITGSGRTTLLWARERRCGLGDEACVVDGTTGSGWVEDADM